MTCEACGEEYSEEAMFLTKCGLDLCSLCYWDHRRQGCYDCAREAGFEAADYDWDKARDT